MGPSAGLLWAACLALCVAAWGAEEAGQEGFHALTAQPLAGGEPFALAGLRGKVVVVANVASECGYTDSGYAFLRELSSRWGPAGTGDVEVVLFPCNQFGEQEPGGAEAIREFVGSRLGEDSPSHLMEKVDVNGPQTDPVYRFLKGAVALDGIRWNFEYFLVGRGGHVDSHFLSGTSLETPLFRERLRYLLQQTEDEAAGYHSHEDL